MHQTAEVCLKRQANKWRNGADCQLYPQLNLIHVLAYHFAVPDYLLRVARSSYCTLCFCIAKSLESRQNLLPVLGSRVGRIHTLMCGNHGGS